MLNTLQKKYASTILKPYLTWYLKQPRTTIVRGFELIIKPSVFHPKYFFSSSYLFDFVSKLNLANKQFLDVGCGSGIMSLLAYQKNAIVTSSDINPKAIDCAKKNFAKNFGESMNDFTLYQSDLFDSIPQQQFDFIVINPPYFFRKIISENELAWNCGKNGEYFTKLFAQLHQFIHAKTEIYMILAENCEIERIKKIAENQSFSFELVEQKKIKWEVNYVFKSPINN